MKPYLNSKLAALAAVALLLPAAAPPEPDLGALEAVDEGELAEQRGGFAWQGLNISFGADIRTYLEDELVLQTVVNWTEEGAVTTQTVSGALTPVDAAALQNGILSSGAITIQVGDARVFLANEGQTAILHQTDGSIRNVLINTASNVSARQEVDATLDLDGYTGFQSDLLGARGAYQISDMINQSVIGSLGH